MLEARAGTLSVLASTLLLASCSRDTVAEGSTAGTGSHLDEDTHGEAGASGCEQDCLPRQHANWPMPNPPGLPWRNGARFESSGETVSEAVTGLEWSRDFVGPVTHAEAVLHCSLLSLDGHADFRLPTRIELVSLLDRSRVPAIDVRHFPRTPADYFWSASEVFGSEELAYSVYFGLGETGMGEQRQAGAYARCVRAGHRAPNPRYEVGGDLIVDRATGLGWERTSSTDPLTRPSAVLYCSEKQSGALRQWRLPTDQELQTLVDADREPPLVDPLFVDASSAPFWALSPPNAEPLVVDFQTGLTVVAAESDARLVRCVTDEGVPAP